MPTFSPKSLLNLSRNVVVQWMAVAVIAGLILGILGPFGSYLNAGWEKRIGYWVASMLLGAAIFGGTLRLVSQHFSVGATRRTLVMAAALIIASLLQALITRTAAFWLWPELHRLNLSPWIWYGQTLTIGGLMFAVWLWLRRKTGAEAVTAGGGAEPFATLPKDVLALQMEDHYVRVHTPSGAQLVLMPLHQAIAQTETTGLKIHRSWWVARHAVRTIEGTPRSMRLHLSNGLVAPVARSAVMHLRKAGWLS